MEQGVPRYKASGCGGGGAGESPSAELSQGQEALRGGRCTLLKHRLQHGKDFCQLTQLISAGSFRILALNFSAKCWKHGGSTLSTEQAAN